MNIKLATDGSCIPNPGPGAFAVVVDLDGKRICKAIPVSQSSNGEMELRAVLEALLMSLTYAAHPLAPLSNPFRSAQSETDIINRCGPMLSSHYRAKPIVICSDSEFVVKGINEWMTGWNVNQWRKRPRRHVEIWKRVYVVKSLLGDRVAVEWVRGHEVNGCALNATADACANTAAREQKPSGAPMLQIIP